MKGIKESEEKQSSYASSGLKPWKDNGLPSQISFRIKQPSRLIGLLKFFKFFLNFPLAMLWINSLD